MAIRHVTETGVEMIKMFEGYRAKPYYCPAGFLTVGFGHVIGESEKEKLIYLSREEAEELLKKDLIRYEKYVLRLINVPLTDGMFDSLVSFTYNLGSGALQRSTLRQKLNREEYQDAADEFPKWCWVNGRKSAGLLKRRLIERDVFLYGNYPVLNSNLEGR